MELLTKQIRLDYEGKKITNQFYLNEDYNVPDYKADVARIIYSTGEIRVEDMKHVENYLRISGKLLFRVLYVTEENKSRPAALEGKLPFEEMVYVEEGCQGHFRIQNIHTEYTATMIHSRKLSMKAMVEMEVLAGGIREEEVAVDVQEAPCLYKKKKQRNLLQIVLNKKDTYRIREEMAISGTGENIGTILWSEVALRKLDSRLEEHCLLLDGELQVFCFYESAEGQPDWVEQTISYEGKVECQGAKEGMFHHLQYGLSDPVVEARSDADGEMRILGVEGTLSMLIAVYEEEEVEFLEDVYSLTEDCKLETREDNYEEMVMQNHSKCKVSEQLALPELKEDILQICHSSGRIQTEAMAVTEAGIQIDGVLYVSFLYVKSSDLVPYDTWQGMVPFSYLMECGQLRSGVHYDMASGLEQLTVALVGGAQIEMKAVLAFHAFLRRKVTVKVITGITSRPYDMEELGKVPGVIGYIARQGDCLWDLAKKYHTTVESIRKTNDLGEEEEEIKIGQKFLILKENTGIL